mmetsp:Transcript_2202/g.6523  ORF Transcript_2202/g.6523 Transcript_2202/m.6523 type:complete len:300 (-) Transcript_2202:61-960(-)
MDIDAGHRQHAGVYESDFACLPLKIVHVHRTRDALAPEDLVLLNLFWKPPVTVHIAEEQLPTRGEDTVCFADHTGLVWAEIHHTVADDKVLRLVFDACLVQVLDKTLDKLHVGLSIAERRLAELFDILLRHRQLLICHVHASHKSGLTNQSSRNVAVATTARAKVQDTPPRDAEGNGCATAVKLFVDLRRHLLDQAQNLRVRPSGSCAGAGLQVLAGGEHFSVVVLHAFIRALPVRTRPGLGRVAVCGGAVGGGRRHYGSVKHQGGGGQQGLWKRCLGSTGCGVRYTLSFREMVEGLGS